MTQDDINRLDSAVIGYMSCRSTELLTDALIERVARDLLQAYAVADDEGINAALDYLNRREQENDK